MGLTLLVPVHKTESTMIPCTRLQGVVSMSSCKYQLEHRADIKLWGEGDRALKLFQATTSNGHVQVAQLLIGHSDRAEKEKEDDDIRYKSTDTSAV
jgi:hypothetical protein